QPAYPYAKVRGILTRKIASAIGRVDFVRVRCTAAGVEPLRVTGASILSSTTRADGFVIVEKNSEGLDEGQEWRATDTHETGTISPRTDEGRSRGRLPSAHLHGPVG